MKDLSTLYTVLVSLVLLSETLAFHIPSENRNLIATTTTKSSNYERHHRHSHSTARFMTPSGEEEEEELEYRNPVTQLLGNFMTKEQETVDPLAAIDFATPKLTKISLELLASCLDAELFQKEWFVTGNVNPIYFCDSFRFQDPDVSLDGIENYARGVNKLFNQQTSRAEIISTVVSQTAPNTITCTWRLSGNVDIGPGLTIKPYIVYTDFTVDATTGLVVFQEDRFDLPQWDILLSALFPFLIGVVTAPPAPPVEPRVVTMPKLPRATTAGGGGNMFQGLFGGKK